MSDDLLDDFLDAPNASEPTMAKTEAPRAQSPSTKKSGKNSLTDELIIATEHVQTAAEINQEAAKVSAELIEDLKVKLAEAHDENSHWRNHIRQSQKQFKTTKNMALGVSVFSIAFSLATAGVAGFLLSQQQSSNDQFRTDFYDMVRTDNSIFQKKLDSRIDEISALIEGTEYKQDHATLANANIQPDAMNHAMNHEIDTHGTEPTLEDTHHEQHNAQEQHHNQAMPPQETMPSHLQADATQSNEKILEQLKQINLQIEVLKIEQRKQTRLAQASLRGTNDATPAMTHDKHDEHKNHDTHNAPVPIVEHYDDSTMIASIELLSKELEKITKGQEHLIARIANMEKQQTKVAHTAMHQEPEHSNAHGNTHDDKPKAAETVAGLTKNQAQKLADIHYMVMKQAKEIKNIQANMKNIKMPKTLSLAPVKAALEGFEMSLNALQAQQNEIEAKIGTVQKNVKSLSNEAAKPYSYKAPVSAQY